MTVSVSHVIFSSLLKIVAGMATVTLVGGAWWMLRGPDLSYVPEMAEHAVVLSDDHKIFVQKFEVTVAEWNQCHADGACDLELRAPAHEDPAFLPATGLNFVDVNQYLDWINRHSRHPFRLPTAEEWDFMAKDVLPEEPDPIFTDPALSWASSYLIEGLAPRRLVRQGSFSVSPEGIVDLDGSVWEWTEDCLPVTVEAPSTAIVARPFLPAANMLPRSRFWSATRPAAAALSAARLPISDCDW